MTCPHCGAPDQQEAYCTACGKAMPAPTAPPRKVSWRRRLAVGIPAVLATLFVVGMVVASVPNPTSILAATLLAVLPTIGYGLLVVSLDKFETEPLRALVAAFAWGAIGAVAVAVVVEVVLSASLPDVLEVTLAAPVVEEVSKGVALLAILLFYRHELDNVLDGIVYGALIGLGFAMTENILYLAAAHDQGGVVGLTALFLVRGVLGGFSHAAYTAITGAAIGWSRQQHGRGAARVVVPVLGLLVAIGLHAAWNGVATLLGTLDNGAASLLALFLMVGLIVLPATGVLLVVSRVVSRRELDLIRHTLLPEVARGTLTPEEYLVVGREDLRPQALLAAELRGGKRLRKAQQRFFRVAADLAFQRDHAAQGDPVGPEAQADADANRLELARLRVQLQAGAPGWSH